MSKLLVCLMLTAIVGAAPVALVACLPHGGPSPDAGPPSVLDGGACPVWDRCCQAEAHLEAIDCHPREPDSGTWREACELGRQHGTFALGCVDRATRRADLEACGVTCSEARP